MNWNTTEPPDEIKAGLKQYLDMMIAAAKNMDAWQGHDQRAQLLLDRGRWYATSARTYAGERGPAHECYSNAGMAALLDKGRYAEGYVVLHEVPLPIEHAWNLDDVDRVIDPTLKPDTKAYYYGIEFKPKYLQQVILKSKHWGLLLWPSVKQVIDDLSIEGAQ